MAMASELDGHPGTVDLAFYGVVENVESDRSTPQLVEHQHTITMIDIDRRYVPRAARAW